MSGTTYTYTQLEGFWDQAGGDPTKAPLMAAIATAESHGQQTATNHDSNGSTDYGLWQVNSVNGYNSARLLNDPLYNARAAVAIEKSQGLNAWTTYRTGAYEPFLHASKTVKFPLTGQQLVNTLNGFASQGYSFATTLNFIRGLGYTRALLIQQLQAAGLSSQQIAQVTSNRGSFWARQWQAVASSPLPFSWLAADSAVVDEAGAAGAGSKAAGAGAAGFGLGNVLGGSTLSNLEKLAAAGGIAALLVDPHFLLRAAEGVGALVLLIFGLWVLAGRPSTPVIVS